MNLPVESTQAEEAADRLLEVMRVVGPCAVAFSGGVDSAVVARAAWELFPEQAIAVTAVSPSLAAAELEIARQEASHIGIAHRLIRTDEFDRSEYRANAGDRCFYCKDTLYATAEFILRETGLGVMVNGANLDDRGDHRPGMKAAVAHSIRSPLIEAGLNKADVRAVARYWNLSVAEKPASPCLSSRIAYGVEVTSERVRMIEEAERCLREMTQVGVLRVRLEHGEIARIEVPVESLGLFVEPHARERITSQLLTLGFRQVTLDLQGFRSGSLNAALPVVSLEIQDQ